MPENESPGQNVGPTLTVTDPNSLVRNRTYQLVGPDADSFDFDTTSRRIRTKRGVTYDFEAKSSYSLTDVGLRRCGWKRRAGGDHHAYGCELNLRTRRPVRRSGRRRSGARAST